VGSQFFSFLATKAHFSSNWASRVRGGKRDQIVVQVAGVLATEPAVTADGVTVHPAEASGLADATPLVEVLHDSVDLLGGESGPEEDRALALGEAVRAGAAAEHAPRLVGTVAAGHREVFRPAFAVVGALRIQATEPRKVVHDVTPQEHPQDGKRVVATRRYNPRTRQNAIDLGHDANPGILTSQDN
jgi:hypothetical protein